MPVSWSETLENIDWNELCNLYKRAPLGNKTPQGLETVFRNSRYRIFAWDSGKLVGAGRALADGADCSYICDIALLPEYQGMGLGKTLVQKLVDFSKDHAKILLYAVPRKEPFYRKLGFSRMKTAMALFRDNDAARAKGLIESKKDTCKTHL